MHGTRFVYLTLIVAAGLLGAMPQDSVAAPQEIVVLSNRADLISGGDALVEIKWPAGTNLAQTTISLNGVSVKSAFAMRPNGRYMGVVTGMNIGNNAVLARHGAVQRRSSSIIIRSKGRCSQAVSSLHHGSVPGRL